MADQIRMSADNESVRSEAGGARTVRSAGAETRYVGRWRVFWVLAGANFIAAMDTTFSNIALPTIADEFGLSLAAAAWIPLAGALTISGMLLPMGRLADLTGRKRMQLAGIVMIGGGSVLAFIAPNVPVLIAARMISSMGVAIVFTQMLSICAAVFPENERSKSLGGAMAASTVGMIVGPLVGGVVIDAAGWRAAYVVMAILSVPCYISSHIVLFEAQIGLAQRPAGIRFDWIGSLLAAGGICLGIFALNEGSRAGWDSPAILGTAVMSVFSLAAFVWWEMRCDDPLFDLSHFRSRVFALAIVARGLGFVGMSSIFFLVPFLVQDVQGRSTGEIGLVFFSGAVAAALAATLLGGLFDRSRVRFAVLGLGLGAVSSVMFAFFSSDTPLALIALASMVSGLGMGIWVTPISAITLSAVDRDSYSSAAAFLNVIRNSVQVAAIAATTAIVTGVMLAQGVTGDLAGISDDASGETAEAFVSGARFVFILGAAMSGVSALAVASLWRREASESPSSAE